MFFPVAAENFYVERSGKHILTQDSPKNDTHFLPYCLSFPLSRWERGAECSSPLFLGTFLRTKFCFSNVKVAHPERVRPAYLFCILYSFF